MRATATLWRPWGDGTRERGTRYSRELLSGVTLRRYSQALLLGVTLRRYSRELLSGVPFFAEHYCSRVMWGVD